MRRASVIKGRLDYATFFSQSELKVLGFSSTDS
jgi:hypothetical protein